MWCPTRLANFVDGEHGTGATPELATALGAAASLKKPLSRLERMEALHGKRARE